MGLEEIRKKEAEEVAEMDAGEEDEDDDGQIDPEAGTAEAVVDKVSKGQQKWEEQRGDGHNRKNLKRKHDGSGGGRRGGRGRGRGGGRGGNSRRGFNKRG